mmetsp:Transcript_24730/g.42099  ORF Transcript_24730/g.42099 Transcript_24730/m.42099 type:complete len:456 (+) Transcript_24730:109-1476(+)
MYWSKVIIASLVASPSFARQQRLGGPALLDHVEMVSEGTVFDEQPLTQFSSRTLVADQQDGVDADAYDGQDIDNNDDGVDEPESFTQVDENGFFDLAPHLDPEFLSLLTDEDRSGLFGYIGDDAELEVARHLGQTTNRCGDKRMFILAIVADRTNPGDNVFKVFFNGRQVMKKGPFNNAVQVFAGMCVPAGELKVEATDYTGDGMQDGSYRVEIDGEIVASNPGTDSWDTIVHTFDTSVSSTSSNTSSSNNNPNPADQTTSPPSRNPTPAPNAITGRGTCFEPRTDEEDDYLDEHNARRMEYHSFHGADYKPLQWSNDLADSAAEYAEDLLQYCCTSTLVHDKTNGGSFGENLASNCGSGSWGQKPSADNILKRWVDDEHDRPNYLNKRHYTQALWRGTERVGCGVAEKDMGNDRTCHMQVCRYHKPGNCGANQSNYLEMMLADSSGCQGTPVDC